MAPSPAADYKSYYSSLGVHRFASTLEIRHAYRTLAMKWHPDKCRKEDAAQAEAAKMKFQGIQEAFSVLSDERKRTLYDIGLYDPDDDEEDSEGLRGFMGELSALMAEVKTESEEMTSFKDLQQLFLSMFSADPMMCGFGNSATAESCTNDQLGGGSSYGIKTELPTDSEGLSLGCEEDEEEDACSELSGGARCSSCTGLGIHSYGRRRRTRRRRRDPHHTSAFVL